MKLNKKIDIKSISTVFVLLVIILVVFFGLNYSFQKNLDSNNNLANLSSAGQNLLQQYSGFSDAYLEGLSPQQKSSARAEIDEAIDAIDRGVTDIQNQIALDRQVERDTANSVKVINDEIKKLSEGLGSRATSFQVFISSADIAKKNYNDKLAACDKLLNITPDQKKAKTTCNIKATNFKKVYDTAIVKINSEKNKLADLEVKKVAADKKYGDKVSACANLLNPDQKKAKTTCNTQATNFKKIADDLAIQIEAEKKYVEVRDVIVKKEEEAAPLRKLLSEIGHKNLYQGDLLMQTSYIRAQLVLLKERIKDVVTGCMDRTAKNFNQDANEDDGSCDYGDGEEVASIPVCDNPVASNYHRYIDANKGEYAENSVCEFTGLEPVDIQNPGDPPISTGQSCDICNPGENIIARELAKPMNIRASVTHFGGPNDNTPGRKEKAAITGQPMKELDTEGTYYVAWPLMEGEKAFGMPSIAECLGEKQGTEDGNIAMNGHLKDRMEVIVSRTDDMGGKRSFIASVVDRGPAGADRLGTSKKFDMSRALYRALHIEEDIERRSKAGSPSEWFDLEVQPISKVANNMCHVVPNTYDIPEHGYRY